MTVFVHVVTPCMNAAATLDRTITSVVTQAGDFKLRFHVQDGGSTDGTLDILEDWRRRLAGDGFLRQCHGIRFTYATESDRGMYDALVKGFATFDATANAFMTWINADDILMPGALALSAALERQFTPAQVSWFGGAVCIINNDVTMRAFDRPIPRDALRAGLCDGVHWDYLRQGGVFFRKWLWNAVHPAQTIAPMKLAGDWNLWRLMAEKASFAQVTYPLGGVRVSEGQLSALQRDNYLNEINDIAPQAPRRKTMEALLAAAPITRRRIKPVVGSIFSIVEECVDKFAMYRHQKVYGKGAAWANRKPPADKVLAEGREITPATVQPREHEFPDITPWVVRQPGLVALDKDWQFPAITEQHAFAQIRDRVLRLPPGILYVGYPWATLIDKLHNRGKDHDVHLDRFEQFCAQLPEDAVKVTVCQHIHGRRCLHLFEKAGIHDVFWSHATHADAAAAAAGCGDGIRLRPFPLYPVQVPQALPEAAAEADMAPRPYLFSFIGARANQYYLKQSRNWILDHLSDDRRGLVIGRDAWHYQKVVYDLQVAGDGTGGDTKTFVDANASGEFKDTLLGSVFALCPSGSGPNSIRLWESMGAGSIPVILADTWAPPGDPRLWEMAAVFCKETPEDIAALPDRLAEIAADPAQLAQMRHAMRQLWLLYGPQSFVSDVLQFFLACCQHESARAVGQPSLSAPENQSGLENPEEARQFLLSWSSRLLLQPEAALTMCATVPGLQASLDKASLLLEGTALTGHFQSVAAFARMRSRPVAAPAVSGGKVPRIALLGRHSHRTPLSYGPIRRLIGNRLEVSGDPKGADLIVTGFAIDWRENVESLRPEAGRTTPKLAVISEEPLWDVTWSGPFTGRDAVMPAGDTEFRYTFLGHETSEIYRFKRLPYFVLTNDRFPVRYSMMLARFGGVTPAELMHRWQKAPVRAAFFAEKRAGTNYVGSFPDRDVTRLSGYRTAVAEASQGTDVLRVGKGWGAPSVRQALPDWHMDKLARLDGQVRIASAYENTHQHDYITEKIFDAFAVGGLPTYWAGPKHRISDLVSEHAMLNTYKLTAEEAAKHIDGFVPDREIAVAWLDTVARLSTLFGDFKAIEAERRRVADAVVDEVLRLL